MKCLPEEYIVLKANDKLSEIEAKYKAEKEYPHEKVVFYTSIGFPVSRLVSLSASALLTT